MKKKTVADKTAMPFLLEFFNVVPLFPGGSSLIKSTIAHLHNEIVKGINENDFLLKFMVIIPDWEIIESCHFGGFGCKSF